MQRIKLFLAGLIVALAALSFAQPALAGSSIGASIANTAACTPNGTSGYTSSAINITGSNFIFVGYSGSYANLTSVSMSDSLGNTWTKVLNIFGPGSSDPAVTGFVSIPTHFGSDTFTLSNANNFSCMFVDARSGVNSGTVTNSQSQGSSGTSSLSFSLLPPDNGSLVYTLLSGTTPTLSGGGGYSLIQSKVGVGGVNYGGALYAQIQGTATTTAPTSSDTSNGVSGYIFSFKPTSYSGAANKVLLHATP